MVVAFTGMSPGVDRHGETASAHTGMALGSLSLILKGYYDMLD